MFERLTERARHVMALAQREAQSLNHSYVGAEHILLAISHEANGPAAKVLWQMGVTEPRLRAEIQRLLAQKTEAAKEPGSASALPAKKLVEYAVEEARGLNHPYIATKHLLLGMLRENGVAAAAMKNLGVNADTVREILRKLPAADRHAGAGRAAWPAGIKQFVVTCSMGKRLIAKGIAAMPAVQAVLKKGMLVITAGTTNGYVAEEILQATGQLDGFSRKGFRRGAITPPGTELPAVPFPGDVVLLDGRWLKGKEIYAVVNDMKAGDMILKGANAIDSRGRAAVLVGNPTMGTAGAVIPAVVGRRVGLIIPIGLEKRIPGDVHDLASELNSTAAEGVRMMPLPGQTFTEIDAIALLTGASAKLVAAGGIGGAEGSLWLAVKGDVIQLQTVGNLMQSVSAEPPCEA